MPSRMLPMLSPSRPIDPQWRCQQSGDCCTKPAEVVMTHAEAQTLVEQAPSTVLLEFRPTATGFVALKAGPCPLFQDQTCQVYAHRPYNCRRFGCMRPDVHAEPFEADGANMMARVQTSRPARRLAQQMQRKAQRWARQHGWAVEETN